MAQPSCWHKLSTSYLASYPFDNRYFDNFPIFLMQLTCHQSSEKHLNYEKNLSIMIFFNNLSPHYRYKSNQISLKQIISYSVRLKLTRNHKNKSWVLTFIHYSFSSAGCSNVCMFWFERLELCYFESHNIWEFYLITIQSF